MYATFLEYVYYVVYQRKSLNQIRIQKREMQQQLKITVVINFAFGRVNLFDTFARKEILSRLITWLGPFARLSCDTFDREDNDIYIVISNMQSFASARLRRLTHVYDVNGGCIANEYTLARFAY